MHESIGVIDNIFTYFEIRSDTVASTGAQHFQDIYISDLHIKCIINVIMALWSEQSRYELNNRAINTSPLFQDCSVLGNNKLSDQIHVHLTISLTFDWS